MHTLLINDVPHILNLGHTKISFLQIDTQLVLPQGLEDLSITVELLFPTLDEDKNVIQVRSPEWVGDEFQDVIH